MDQSKCVQELLVLLWLRCSSENQCLAATVSDILHPPHVLFDVVVISWMAYVHQVRVDVAVHHPAYAKWAFVHAFLVRNYYTEALYVHQFSLSSSAQLFNLSTESWKF